MDYAENAIMSPSNWLKNVLRGNDPQGSAIPGPRRTLLGFHCTPRREVCGDNVAEIISLALWGCVPGRAEGSGSYRVFSPLFLWS